MKISYKESNRAAQGVQFLQKLHKVITEGVDRRGLVAQGTPCSLAGRTGPVNPRPDSESRCWCPSTLATWEPLFSGLPSLVAWALWTLTGPEIHPAKEAAAGEGAADRRPFVPSIRFMPRPRGERLWKGTGGAAGWQETGPPALALWGALCPPGTEPGSSSPQRGPVPPAPLNRHRSNCPRARRQRPRGPRADGKSDRAGGGAGEGPPSPRAWPMGAALCKWAGQPGGGAGGGGAETRRRCGAGWCRCSRSAGPRSALRSHEVQGERAPSWGWGGCSEFLRPPLSGLPGGSRAALARRGRSADKRRSARGSPRHPLRTSGYNRWAGGGGWPSPARLLLCAVSRHGAPRDLPWGETRGQRRVTRQRSAPGCRGGIAVRGEGAFSPPPSAAGARPVSRLLSRRCRRWLTGVSPVCPRCPASAWDR